MKIQQLSIFVENREGRLAQITEVLAAAQIDIRAISVADTSDFGILRLIVNDPGQAVKALKAAGREDLIGFGKKCLVKINEKSSYSDRLKNRNVTAGRRKKR